MKAISHHGRPALRYQSRDSMGKEIPTLRVMEVEDAIALRDELSEVIRECSGNASRVKQMAAPEVAAEDYTIGSLMAALTMKEVQLPVWIRFGNTRHLLTPENVDGVARGLLLALELSSREGER